MNFKNECIHSESFVSIRELPSGGEFNSPTNHLTQVNEYPQLIPFIHDLRCSWDRGRKVQTVFVLRKWLAE